MICCCLLQSKQPFLRATFFIQRMSQKMISQECIPLCFVQTVACALICLAVRSYVVLRLSQVFVFFGSCMLLTFNNRNLSNSKHGHSASRVGWGSGQWGRGWGMPAKKTFLINHSVSGQHNSYAHPQRVEKTCCAKLLPHSNVFFL